MPLSAYAAKLLRARPRFEDERRFRKTGYQGRPGGKNTRLQPPATFNNGNPTLAASVHAD